MDKKEKKKEERREASYTKQFISFRLSGEIDTPQHEDLPVLANHSETHAHIRTNTDHNWFYLNELTPICSKLGYVFKLKTVNIP